MRSRDLRIDFWRGVALLTIFINHIPGNFYERLTPRNFGLSDAAELFVFLAGFSAALAYFPKFMEQSALAQTYRCLNRAATLYIAHIVSLIACIAIFAVAAMFFEDLTFVQMINIGPVMDNPLAGFLGIATLGHQVGYFNILPLYVILIATTPLIMALARVDLALPLVAASVLYLLTQIFGWNLSSFPNDGVWFFNPFAWQLLFVIAFTIGCVARAGMVIPFNRVVYALAVGYLVLGAVAAVNKTWLVGDIELPTFLWALDKTNLALPRLLHVLALVYVVVYMPGAAKLVRRLTMNNPFVAMGRNALPVFCASSLLSMVGLILRDEYGNHFLLDTVIVGSGFLLLLGLARALDWTRYRSRPTRLTTEKTPAYRLSAR